jgi:hypothetical protein
MVLEDNSYYFKTPSIWVRIPDVAYIQDRLAEEASERQTADSELQTQIDGKQNSLNRAVGGNDNATGTVTDTGGNLSIPVPVTTAVGTSDATQLAAGTNSLRTFAQKVLNNLANLFLRLGAAETNIEQERIERQTEDNGLQAQINDKQDKLNGLDTQVVRGDGSLASLVARPVSGNDVSPTVYDTVLAITGNTTLGNGDYIGQHLYIYSKAYEREVTLTVEKYFKNEGASPISKTFTMGCSFNKFLHLIWSTHGYKKTTEEEEEEIYYMDGWKNLSVAEAEYAYEAKHAYNADNALKAGVADEANTAVTIKDIDNLYVKVDGADSSISMSLFPSTEQNFPLRIWLYRIISKINALVYGKFSNPVGTASQYLNGAGTPTAFPTIPVAPVQSNWNETNSSSLAFILNKPSIPTMPDLSWTENLGEHFTAQSGVSVVKFRFSFHAFLRLAFIEFRIKITINKNGHAVLFASSPPPEGVVFHPHATDNYVRVPLATSCHAYEVRNFYIEPRVPFDDRAINVCCGEALTADVNKEYAVFTLYRV